MATAPATATLEQPLAHPLRPEGDWRHVFSYHPMDVEIERAEGVYIYDREGTATSTSPVGRWRSTCRTTTRG